MKSFGLFLTAILLGIACAVEYKDIEEKFGCDVDAFSPDPFISMETLKWIESVKVWYTPVANGVDTYRTTEDLLGAEEFAKVSQKYLDKICEYSRVNGTDLHFYGFGDRYVKYESFADPLRPGIFYWSVRDPQGRRKYHATTIVTKTDNKNFFVAVTFWKNGLKGFTANSPIPSFSPEVKQEIIKHVTEIGFDTKNFIEISYENCPEPPKELFEY